MFGNEKTLYLQPKKIFFFLGFITILLVLMSIVAQYAKYQFGFPTEFASEFYLEAEDNLPTFFSTVILSLSSLLLGIIGALKKNERDRFSLHWLSLSVIFLCVSIGEATGLHERLSSLISDLLGGPGWSIFNRVILGIAIVLVISISYLRFLLHLPYEIKRLFFLAVTLYLGGAIGLELIGWMYYDFPGGQNLTYSIISTLEEAFEMTGTLVFIYAQLIYISRYGIQIRMSPEV
jgi:hypothetical protein